MVVMFACCGPRQKRTVASFSCRIYLLARDRIRGEILLFLVGLLFIPTYRRVLMHVVTVSTSVRLPLKFPSTHNIEPMATMAKKHPYRLPPQHQ